VSAKKASAVIALIALFVLILLIATPPRDVCIGTMEVTVFGIGRADAILITTENHAVMIDTGENRHGEYLVTRLAELGIGRLDYLIITHFDSDHVGGAHVIIDHFEIGEVIVPNYSRESRHMERFNDAVRRAGLVPYVLMEPRRFTLDNTDFIIDPSGLGYVYIPRYEDISDYEHDDDRFSLEYTADHVPVGDNFSIVTVVSHGDNHFLFMGDAMEIRLEEVLANDTLMALDYAFVKLPRHGRFTGRGLELIHTTRPRYAVITGFHPADIETYYPERPADERVIYAVEYVGAEVFFTMSEGVRMVSGADGTISVTEIKYKGE